jgi:hypothetical protein
MAANRPITGTVDASALKVNQTLIVGLVLLGFLIGRTFGAYFLAFVAASLASGVIWPGRGWFQLLYARVLRPTGLVKPRVEPGEVAPHRFAQTLGAAFLTASILFLAAGATMVGWALALLVAALALINLVFGFCAGCFAFLQLRRLWRGRTATPA